MGLQTEAQYKQDLSGGCVESRGLSQVEEFVFVYRFEGDWEGLGGRDVVKCVFQNFFFGSLFGGWIEKGNRVRDQVELNFDQCLLFRF